MTQQICRRNKFGYCMFGGDKCRYLHIEETCENEQCDILNCQKRHPRTCNFYRDYRRCKFSDYCRYKHDQPNDQITLKFEERMKAFENVIDEKDAKILELEKEVNSNKQRMDSLEKIINGNQDILKEISEKVEKNMEIAENKINQYYEKTKSCFKKLAAKLDDGDDDNELQHVIFEVFDDNVENDEQEKSNLLDETFANPSLGFPCDMCGYIGKTESGLKTHKTRKHNKKV